MLQRNFTLPIPTHSRDYPIVQYADDTLIVLPASDHQLIALKDMLDVFSTTTGLSVNFAKSLMVPMNMSNDEANILASILGCWGLCLSLTWVIPCELQGPQFRI